MKKIKIVLLATAIAMLILPPTLNFIITLPRLPNIEVVGEDIHWLSFYGTYIGSFLSTISAFFILYFTIKSSIEEQKTDFLHKELWSLQNDMANRFSQYNIAEVINLSILSKPQEKQIREEMSRLQSVREKYCGLLYSSRIIYEHRKEIEAKDFFKAYESMMQKSVKNINDVIIFFSSLKGKEWDDESTNEIFRYSESLNDLSIENQYVNELATSFITKLDDEIRNRQNM